MSEQTRLEVLDVRQPLGRVNVAIEWVNETTVNPWVIYVMGND